MMKLCTNAYISPLTLGSSDIIVILLPGPVISGSKVIKPGTSEKCQNRAVFLSGSRREGIYAFPCPLTESLGRHKRMPVKGTFCLPLPPAKMENAQRCPIFSVPVLAKGVAFLKVQIRNHHPRRTKSKQKISQWKQDFGFKTFPHFIASLCFWILFLASLGQHTPCIDKSNTVGNRSSILEPGSLRKKNHTAHICPHAYVYRSLSGII